MRTRLQALIAALPLLAIHLYDGTAWAQQLHSALSVGAVLGYGVTRHVTDGLTCQADCPQLTDGKGSAPLFGALVDWGLKEHFGVTLRAQYLLSSVDLTNTVESDSVQSKNLTGQPVNLQRKFTMTVHVPEMMTCLSAWYSFDRLRVSAGAAGGILVGPTWQEVSEILSPDNVTFTSTNRRDSTLLQEQSLTNAVKTQLHIVLGASYDFPISRRATLAPEINVYFPLSSLKSDVSKWSQTIYSIGATLRFGILSDRPPQPPTGPGGGAR